MHGCPPSPVHGCTSQIENPTRPQKATMTWGITWQQIAFPEMSPPPPWKKQKWRLLIAVSGHIASPAAASVAREGGHLSTCTFVPAPRPKTPAHRSQQHPHGAENPVLRRCRGQTRGARAQRPRLTTLRAGAALPCREERSCLELRNTLTAAECDQATQPPCWANSS